MWSGIALGLSREAAALCKRPETSSVRVAHPSPWRQSRAAGCAALLGPTDLGEVTLRRKLWTSRALAPARQGQVGGLLGNADGGPANDLASRGGTVVEVAGLAAETRRARLYGEFGDSWRISQAESLFTYGPGEDTSTYSRPDFPSALVAASDLPPLARGMAEAVCRQAGITGAAFLADCALDVGVTGNAEFAASAAAVEAALAPAPDNTVTVAASMATRSYRYLDSFSTSRPVASLTIGRMRPHLGRSGSASMSSGAPDGSVTGVCRFVL